MFHLLIVGLLLILCVVATAASNAIKFRIGRYLAFQSEEHSRLLPTMFAAAGFMIGAVCSLLCLVLAANTLVRVTEGV